MAQIEAREAHSSWSESNHLLLLEQPWHRYARRGAGPRLSLTTTMAPPPYAQALASALPVLPTFEASRIEPVHAPVPSAQVDPTELPSYSAVPRLRAEKLFWYGFTCQYTRPEIALTRQARCCGSSARCD